MVEPIRSVKDIRKIKSYLKNDCTRDYVMFLIGIYTGLRISDILPLKVKDVRGRSKIKIKQQKTGEVMTIGLNKELVKILKAYTEGKPLDEYLIKTSDNVNEPIGRVQAYRILNRAAEMCGVNNIGCHSMRKTYGRNIYLQNKNNLALTQRALGHKDATHTYRYIGIDVKEVGDANIRLKY